MTAAAGGAPGQRRWPGTIARLHRAPRAIVRRLLAARGGNAGIEFALSGPLFLILLFAILEMGLDTFTQAELDDAAHDAARQIALGNDTTSASVVGTVCIKLVLISPKCTSSVSVYVTSGTSFASLTAAHVTAAGGLSSSTFTPGGANADVLLQVAFTRTFVLPFFSSLIGGNQTNTLLSSVAFQNEPF
jgi:Flp pilus assembly protein TadG